MGAFLKLRLVGRLTLSEWLQLSPRMLSPRLGPTAMRVDFSSSASPRGGTATAAGRRCGSRCLTHHRRLLALETAPPNEDERLQERLSCFLPAAPRALGKLRLN